MDTCRHVELQQGRVRATVCVTGAALIALTVDGITLIAPAAGNPCPLEEYRGSVLAPWPGRVGGGTYVHAGRAHALPCNDTANGAALHGLAAHRPWRVTERAAGRTTLGLRLGDDAGYPYAVALSAAYVLRSGGLRCTLTAVNRHATTVPVGLGAHPYLTVGATVDVTHLQVPAGTVVPLDDRGLPLLERPTRGSALDYQTAQAIGSARLDHAFTDLRRAEDGWTAVVLTGPLGRPRIRVGLGPTAGWVGIYTSDTLPPPARRGSIAVEPMTCPADALRSSRDLALLRSGDALVLDWSVDLDDPDEGP